MNPDGSVNLNSVMGAADIGNAIRHDFLVVMKSTVPVGTGFKVKTD